MNITKKIVCLIAMLFVLSGCATVFSGTTQNINVMAIDSETNEPIKGVKCTVRDGDGMVHVVMGNPGTFVINKGQGALTPICKKDDYTQISYGVGENFNAITLINVLFWPGFIVDIATGAMKKYPSHMTIMMEKNA